MPQSRRLAIQLALTWCATGLVLNAIQMTRRAAVGLPLVDPPLFWTLLRWSLWIVLVPVVVMLARGSGNVFFHIVPALSISLAHGALFGAARVLSGVPVMVVLQATRERFWLDLSHDLLIYTATVVACRADRFLADLHAATYEAKRLESVMREADDRAARNRLQPDEISEALRNIASILPHDAEAAEERLDELARSLRHREEAVPVATAARVARRSSLLPLRLMLIAVVGLAVGGVSLVILGSMTTAAAGFAILDLRVAHRRRLRAFELEQRCAEAEERFLRARLEPHFLFNSLNSIAALIESDRKLAAEMLEKLRELYTIAFTPQGGEITIADELALVERYLFVESIRFRDRMRVFIECDPSLHHAAIPRLLLQPLVENAVRHGIARRSEPGQIAIEIVREREAIRATIENDVDEQIEERGERDGLALTRSRLRARYGSRGRLDVQRAPGRFCVDLRWPCAW